MNRMGRIAAATVAIMAVLVMTGQARDRKGPETRRREIRDAMSGVPEKILKLQSIEKVKPLSIDAAVAVALKAADEAARPLIDTTFHKGKHLIVPDAFKTIQSAIDAATPGDVVLVKPGTYYELIVMKDGVKLVSDSAKGGDELVAVKGARMKLPRRTMRTIIDGSKSKTSRRGMIDFDAGLGRNTIVDGFTIQNLPKQDHHVPGHPHGLNVRGASPVIVNCYVRSNGSTGIGSHVVFADQDREISERDFRWANVKHGAAPTIIGNIVHDNPGGGILCGVGEAQGTHGIDRPTHPTVMKNVLYQNGKVRPAVSSGGGGSKEMPVRFLDNFVYDTDNVGIALQKGAVGIIENNMVCGTTGPGIAVNGSIALKLNGNQVKGAQGPGLVMTDRAKVLQMVGNAADSNSGPRFLLRAGSVIADPAE